MKVKNTSNLEIIATGAIFVIWLFMTVSLLWGFSLDLAYKILFGAIGGITFECGHLWSLIKLKTYWDDKVKRRPYFILWVIMAFFTILAAVSFSGKTIQAMTATVVQSKIELIDLKDKIDRNKNTIENYTKFQNLYAGDSNRITSFNKSVSNSAALQITNDILIKQYVIMASNQNINIKSESDDAFSFYADLLRWSKSLVIIILLGIFFTAIEYMFFLMTPSEEQKLVISEKKDEILKYVDALMDTEDNKVKLIKDEVISEKTGIPFTQCKEYRKMLNGRAGENSIMWKGTPIITTKQGGTRANFSKEDTKKLVIQKAYLS